MNLNVLLQNVGASQLSYIVIRNLNELAQTKPEIDVAVFYENMHRNCLPPNFAVMQIAEAWGQHGPIIATSLSTAFKLISFPSKQKFFYVWDLEWLRGQNRQYEQYVGVYTQKELTLIVRSQAHADIIQNAFNRKAQHIVEDFDVNQILEITNE
jgi:hypothetical protein